MIGGIAFDDPLVEARVQSRNQVPDEFWLHIATSLKAALATEDADVRNVTATEDNAKADTDADDAGGRGRRLAQQLYKLDVEYTARFASFDQAADYIELVVVYEDKSKLLNGKLAAELQKTDSFEGQKALTPKFGTPTVDSEAAVMDMSADAALRGGWVKCRTGHRGPMCKMCQMPEYVPAIGGLCMKCTAASGTAAWIVLVVLALIPGMHYAMPALQRMRDTQVTQDETGKKMQP